jgi:hypothetical protein
MPNKMKLHSTDGVSGQHLLDAFFSVLKLRKPRKFLETVLQAQATNENKRTVSI